MIPSAAKLERISHVAIFGGVALFIVAKFVLKS